MFNLILNNLVESVKNQNVSCIYEISASSIANDNMCAIAKVSIDRVEGINAIEFYNRFYDKYGLCIEYETEKISKNQYMSYFDNSDSIKIMV